MESDYIRLYIGKWIDKRISYSCLSCKIENFFWFFLFKNSLKFVKVLKRSFVEFKFWIFCKNLSSCIFQIHIVVIVLIIKSNHFFSSFKEVFCCMKSDKSTTSSNKCLHELWVIGNIRYNI